MHALAALTCLRGQKLLLPGGSERLKLFSEFLRNDCDVANTEVQIRMEKTQTQRVTAQYGWRNRTQILTLCEGDEAACNHLIATKRSTGLRRWDLRPPTCTVHNL